MRKKVLAFVMAVIATVVCSGVCFAAYSCPVCEEIRLQEQRINTEIGMYGDEDISIPNYVVQDAQWIKPDPWIIQEVMDYLKNSSNWITNKEGQKFIIPIMYKNVPEDDWYASYIELSKILYKSYGDKLRISSTYTGDGYNVLIESKAYLYEAAKLYNRQGEPINQNKQDAKKGVTPSKPINQNKQVIKRIQK